MEVKTRSCQDNKPVIEKLFGKAVDNNAPEAEKKRVNALIEAYRRGPIVIKVGGSILDKGGKTNGSAYGFVVDDIQTLRSLDIPLVLVHGGGWELDKAMKDKGMKIEKIDGQRVSNAEAVEVIKKVMTRIGERITDSMRAAGIDAVQILGHKGVLSVEKLSEELGYVGRITYVNTEGISESISSGKVPVITPLGFSDGHVYNINADLAGGSIAGALASTRIIFITDVDGIYDKNGRYMRELSAEDIMSYLDNKAIHGGMVPKANAVLHAISNNVNASIINGNHQYSVLSHLFYRRGTGTKINVRDNE